MDIKDPRFRAVYYEILHQQAMIALRMVCSQQPSVALGMERIEDKISMYLDDAKDTGELKSYLQSDAWQEPPQRLIEWLSAQVEEHNAKTQTSLVPISNPQDPDQEGGVV